MQNNKRKRSNNFAAEEKAILITLINNDNIILCKKNAVTNKAKYNAWKILTETILSTMPRNINSKRTDYIEWHEYFMAMASLAAKRSKDPCTQVGACIVNQDKNIVGIGYNGMPTGCSDDEFPWNKESDSSLNSKYLYVCHAELNAILNKTSADIKNCAIYVSLFPCNECAKLIIQSGIKEVIYLSDKHAHKIRTIASKRMFDAVSIKYWQYIPKHDKLLIDFSEINLNLMSQCPLSPINSQMSDLSINSIEES